jgi:hypothetical protein
VRSTTARLVVTLIAIVLAWTIAAPARASSGDPSIVFIIDEGVFPEGAEGLDSALRAHLRDVDVMLLVLHEERIKPLTPEVLDEILVVGEGRGAAAVFWLAHAEGGGLQLFLASVPDELAYVRELEHEEGSTDATVEAVGLIVRMAILALLDGSPPEMERLGVERAKPQAPAPVPEPPRRQGEFRVALGYAGQYFAPAVKWQNGAGVWLGYRFEVGLALGLGYALLTPARATDQISQLVVRRNPIELDLGYGGKLGPVHLSGQVQLLADAAVRSATTDDPALAPTPKAANVTWGVGAGLLADFQIVRFFGLFVHAGAELWVTRTRYGVDAPAPLILIDPGLVRPRAAAGTVFRW